MVSPIRQPNYSLAKPFRLIRHYAEAQTISPSALTAGAATGKIDGNIVTYLDQPTAFP